MTTLAPEILALLQSAISTTTESSVVVGFNLGLLQSAYNNRTTRDGKPRVVTYVRGDLINANAPLIKAGGKTSTIEEANSWFGIMGELAEAEGAVLDLTVTFDFKTLGNIIKSMQKEGMSYANVTLTRVAGIHQRIAKTADGKDITALTVDIYDRDNITVVAASNPMAASATYTDSDDAWMEAVKNSSARKRAGMDKWRATRSEDGEKTIDSSEPGPSLDDLEEELVAMPQTV